MPQVFRIGTYIIHFWSNEGLPLEPIHVHISKGKPSAYSTKVWLLQDGECVVEDNKNSIPSFQLKYILELIKVRRNEIEELWLERFGGITYKR